MDPGIAPPEPRAVPADHVIGWFAEGMRLFKRGPARFCVLAVLYIAAEFALALVPGAGSLAGKLVAPLLACGMLYGAEAAERGERPRVRHVLSIFSASAPAIVAILAASLLTFAVEAWTADAVGGVDLLNPSASDAAAPDVGVVLAIYAAGIAVSLPLTFVPLLALFGGGGFVASFRLSVRAFTLNPLPMLAYGLLGFVLIAFGLMTMGIGLVLVLPLLATSSYAAFKSIFGGSERVA